MLPFAEFVVLILDIYMLDPDEIGDIISPSFRCSPCVPHVFPLCLLSI